MKKIIMMLVVVLVCSAIASAAFDYTISDGQYEHGSVRLEGQESLLVTGGGRTLL